MGSKYQWFGSTFPIRFSFILLFKHLVPASASTISTSTSSQLQTHPAVLPFQAPFWGRVFLWPSPQCTGKQQPRTRFYQPVWIPSGHHVYQYIMSCNIRVSFDDPKHLHTPKSRHEPSQNDPPWVTFQGSQPRGLNISRHAGFQKASGINNHAAIHPKLVTSAAPLGAWLLAILAASEFSEDLESFLGRLCTKKEAPLLGGWNLDPFASCLSTQLLSSLMLTCIHSISSESKDSFLRQRINLGSVLLLNRVS